jgi:hypothetical protein
MSPDLINPIHSFKSPRMPEDRPAYRFDYTLAQGDMMMIGGEITIVLVAVRFPRDDSEPTVRIGIEGPKTTALVAVDADGARFKLK